MVQKSAQKKENRNQQMVFWFVTFPKQCWNKSNLKDKTCWRRGWWVKKGRCKGVDLRWRLCLRIHNQSHHHRHPHVHPAQYHPHSDLFQPWVASRDNMVELWEERSVSCRFQIKHLPTILAMMMMTIMVVKMVVVMKMFKKWKKRISACQRLFVYSGFLEIIK